MITSNSLTVSVKKLTAAQVEAEALKAQLTEAGTTIEGFKKLDITALKPPMIGRRKPRPRKLNLHPCCPR